MKLVAFIFFILSFVPGFVSAFDWQPDFSYGVLARSYPLSGTVFFDSGLGLPVWNKAGESDVDKVLYGYLRPSVTGNTSGPFNSLAARLEVYPVSFFGFSAGRSLSLRGMNISGYDCFDLQCQGTLHSQFVSSKLALGFADYFAVLGLKKEWWSSSVSASGLEGDRPYVEPATATLLSPGNESTVTQQLALGMTLASGDRFLLAHARSENYLSKNQSENTYFIYRTRDPGGSHSTYGIGSFQSEQKSARWSILFVRDWTVWKKIGLGL